MNRFRSSILATLVASTTTAACADGDETDRGTYEPVYAAGMLERQTRALVGATADGYAGPPGHRFAVATTLSTGVTVEVHGACLTDAADPTRTCRDFVGAATTGSDGSSIEIVGAAAGSQPGTMIYDVLRDGEPLCPPDGAYPLSGAATTSGYHDTIPGWITFSCRDPQTDVSNREGGALAMAIDWGFVPGEPGSDATLAHQLATRMSRGDYCADGTTRTLDGTAIVHHVAGDPLGEWTNTLPGQVADGALYPEAAWAEGEGVAVVCLTKLRWSTMPAGDLCGGALPDPRLHGPAEARFCEDWPDPTALWTVSRIQHESEYTTLALQQWRSSTDSYASAEGFWGGTRGSVLPYGATAAYASTAADHLGTVLTDDGIAVWLDRYPGAQLVKLVATYHATKKDWVTTTPTKIPAGYAKAGVNYRDLGWYLFSSIPTAANRPTGFTSANFRALYRFKSTSTNDFLTTTQTSVPGYAKRVLLGYLVQM